VSAREQDTKQIKARNHARLPTRASKHRFGCIAICILSFRLEPFQQTQSPNQHPLAAEYAGHMFVGPDNGLFAPLIQATQPFRAVRIDPARLGESQVSNTFHGRDIFGPAAGLLAAGSELSQLGDSTLPDVAVGPPAPAPPTADGGAVGRVVLVDHFGNLITDIEEPTTEASPAWCVAAAGRTLRIVGTYSEAQPNECVGVWGSFGTLELAARDSSAARLLGVGRGTRVELVPA